MNPSIIVLIKLKKYARIFRQAGAISPNKAINPETYGIPNSLLFQKMVRQRLLLPIGDGRYYLDESRETVLRNNRLKVVATIAILVLIILTIVSLFR